MNTSDENLIQLGIGNQKELDNLRKQRDANIKAKREEAERNIYEALKKKFETK
jgi:hypothetical protein